MKYSLVLLLFIAACSNEPVVAESTKTPDGTPNTQLVQKNKWKPFTEHFGDMTFEGGKINEKLGNTSLSITCNNGRYRVQLFRPNGYGSDFGMTDASLFITNGGQVVWRKDRSVSFARDKIAFFVTTNFMDALKLGRLSIYIDRFDEGAYFNAQTWGQDEAFSRMDANCKS